MVFGGRSKRRCEKERKGLWERSHPADLLGDGFDAGAVAFLQPLCLTNARLREARTSFCSGRLQRVKMAMS